MWKFVILNAIRAIFWSLLKTTDSNPLLYDSEHLVTLNLLLENEGEGDFLVDPSGFFGHFLCPFVGKTSFTVLAMCCSTRLDSNAFGQFL